MRGVTPTGTIRVPMAELLAVLSNSGFRDKFGVDLFSHDIDDESAMKQVSRFHSRDQASLLRLAKELVRVFSDRLNIRDLRKLSAHAEKEKLGSNKLLQLQDKLRFQQNLAIGYVSFQ